MHNVSQAFERIYSHAHTVHSMINLEVEGGDSQFIEIEEDKLYGVDIKGSVFPGESPSIGNFTSREIDVTFEVPQNVTIPKRAKIMVNVYIEDGVEISEWVRKGEFFTDTREYNADKTVVTLHGFDAAIKFETDFDSSDYSWPVEPTYLVESIAESVGVELNDDWEKDTYGFNIPNVSLQTNATKREILQWIAAMYCGNFVIDDFGKLKFIPYNTMFSTLTTGYLIDEIGNRLTIGGDRILV